MSSNRRLRAVTLRARLIAEQLALLAMVCVIIGVVTVFTLRAFLLDQLDGQLAAASARSTDFTDPRPDPPGRGEHRPPIDAPGQGAGTVNARITDGQVIDALRLAPGTGRLQSLPADGKRDLITLPVDGRAYTRDLGSFGTYRLMAVRTGNSDIVVTGLPMESTDDTIGTVSVILGLVSIAGLAIAGVAGVLIVRRTLRPLDRMAAAAGKVTELPLDRGDVALPVRVPLADTDPRTEVGKVGAALNRMLGHVDAALAARQASETRVRQFVADASHELRTPLTAIRGYTELVGRSEHELPPEVVHALGRVRSEAGRMSTLVDDLLLLARLDSGRPLLREPVDLSRLVIDTVSDARVSGPEHHWRLDLPASPVQVIGDQDRLHQMLANLLVNAYTHTPAGCTVSTGLTVRPGFVELTVTDDGPGIPPELGATVFERFVRADGSRGRTSGGNGLGLSIVSAIVAAHGGAVSLSSTPGKTTVAVQLPEAPP